MTLGTFINNMDFRLQGNIVISVWDEFIVEELDRIEIETDGGLRGFKKTILKGLLCCPIIYMFANYGQLVIEIKKKGE